MSMVLSLFEDTTTALRTVGYLVIGLLILFINCPVLFCILRYRKLRRRYALLISVLLTNALTGLAVFITGGKRTLLALVVAAAQYSNDTAITTTPNPQIVALVFLNVMNGVGLLLESGDRLLAMLAPLLYFRKSMQLAIAMVAVSNCFVLMTVFSAIIATIAGPVQNVSNICRQEDLMGQNFYVFFAAMRTASAGGSVILIALVLLVLKRNLHRPFLAKISAKRSFKKFISVQTRYSHTLVISSIFTLLLFVLPTAYDLIVRLLSSTGNRGRQSLYSLILSYLNAFNMAAVIVYRHHDIRSKLLRPCGYQKRPKPAMARSNSQVATVDNANGSTAVTANVYRQRPLNEARNKGLHLIGRQRSHEMQPTIFRKAFSHRDLFAMPRGEKPIIWRISSKSAVIIERSAEI